MFYDFSDFYDFPYCGPIVALFSRLVARLRGGWGGSHIGSHLFEGPIHSAVLTPLASTAARWARRCARRGRLRPGPWWLRHRWVRQAMWTVLRGWTRKCLDIPTKLNVLLIRCCLFDVAWYLVPATWYLVPGTWYLLVSTWYLVLGTWHASLKVARGTHP